MSRVPTEDWCRWDRADADDDRRQVHPAEHAPGETPAVVFGRDRPELDHQHERVERGAPGHLEERGGRLPREEDHPGHPRTTQFDHQDDDVAEVQEEPHGDRGPDHQRVAMKPEDLDDQGHREAGATERDEAEDAEAHPPAPGIGVVDVRDRTDSEREARHREARTDDRDYDERDVPERRRRAALGHLSDPPRSPFAACGGERSKPSRRTR